MSDSISLGSVTLTCPEATRLADFYAEITGGRVTFRHPAWASVVGPGGRIDCQTVADYSPPRWPQDTSLVHLDFLVDDLGATEARVLAAGAARCEAQPNPEHCLVFTDPVGHPFCLTTVDELG